MATVNPSINSSSLFRTSVPTKSEDPRAWYLRNGQIAKPPWIVVSHFVPDQICRHLMRKKKNAAIAVKFVKYNDPPDKITNMEGVLHSFITPIVNTTMHGDYQWQGGHGIYEFGSREGYQLGRRVLLSALVQQDFEDDKVVVRLVLLEETQVVGSSKFPQIPDTQAKQNDDTRRHYDRQLRKYLVYHLTSSHSLPAAGSVSSTSTMSVSQTIQFLADTIEHHSGGDIDARMRNRYIHHKNSLLSLEIMFRTAFHQLRNEFFGLEKVSRAQGYVYTFNPPAIFARFFNSPGTRVTPGTELMSRIHVVALKYLASFVSLRGCRCFAWSDFSSPTIMPLIRKALAGRPHIVVRRMSELFIDRGIKQQSGEGLYVPPEGARGAMLVIHNNSDAFGQNIETEWSGGSLDGVIGSYSSAAASLLRQRSDLCDNIIRTPA
ncbi:hypothetical protein BT63DRAFT_123295 [Microthyrium microscopicum]|uniref:Uncharacterized protein n=1 Tax=Microthyrium microscopicum TaxID=703497 RepID=A0A6A6TT72_9PEZI|nr:hypothetical protein BT63DRAFT_123295 [Microthyrium microscopicum]